MKGELNTESKILFIKSSLFLREGLKFSLVKVVIFSKLGGGGRGVVLPNPNLMTLNFEEGLDKDQNFTKQQINPCPS